MSSSIGASGVLGLIGGSGLLKSTLFSEVYGGEIVSTEFGDVLLRDFNVDVGGEGNGPPATLRIVFVQRHAADPDARYSPPHLINHRACAAALRKKGVETVVGVCSVGSLHPDRMPVGSFIVADDFFSFFDIISLHDDHEGHHVPEFDATVRAGILKAFENQAY